MTSFLYNFVLVVVYTAVLTYAFCMYATRRNAYYRPLMLLFTFYLLDSVIIYMTESIPWLGTWYNDTFMSVPAVKTVIYLVTAYALLQTFNEFTNFHFSVKQAMVLVTLGLWYLFIPMLENGPVKVWLYYFVYQVFTFIFGWHSFRLLKKSDMEGSVWRELRILMVLQMIFSVCIVVEDSIVIFNVDIYSATRIFIHDRNTSEDILRLCSSLIILSGFWKRTAGAKKQVASFPPAEESGDTSEIQLENAEGLLSENCGLSGNTKDPEDSTAEIAYRKLCFAQSLHLTEREQEIFNLLLEDHNNQEISDRLFISIGTVKTHVHNIFQKSGVSRRYELIEQYRAFNDAHKA